MIHFEHSNFIKEINKSSCKILAIDLGDKKIGLATSHVTLKIVIPLKNLLRKNNAYDIKTLKQEIINNDIDAIVFGLPLDCSGDYTDATTKVIDFAMKLIKKISKPITFFDERYTTKIANQKLMELGISRSIRNKIDDQIAASIILEDFLKFNSLS